MVSAEKDHLVCFSSFSPCFARMMYLFGLGVKKHPLLEQHHWMPGSGHCWSLAECLVISGFVSLQHSGDDFKNAALWKLPFANHALGRAPGQLGTGCLSDLLQTLALPPEPEVTKTQLSHPGKGI